MPDLPIEILREIFAYLSSPLRVHRAHEFPWYLGNVCSRWRALFFSMRSTFWKKIEIDWEHNFLRLPRFSERLKVILAFFLNRTQGAPFSFSLFREDYYPDKKHVRWILKDLLDHSRQWEEVFIRTKPMVFDFNLLRNAKGHLPLLKRLEITTTTHSGPPVHPSFADIFKDAPLLTHVVLQSLPVWEFNWSSLTILGIGYQNDIYKSLAILQKTVNLVKLTFSDVFFYRDVGVEDMGLMIHFPHLECLSIVGINILTIILETPVLQRLEIRVTSCSDEVVSYFVMADKTVDFLRRSRLKLTFVEESKSDNKVVLHTSTFWLRSRPEGISEPEIVMQGLGTRLEFVYWETPHL